MDVPAVLADGRGDVRGIHGEGDRSGLIPGLEERPHGLEEPGGFDELPERRMPGPGEHRARAFELLRGLQADPCHLDARRFELCESAAGDQHATECSGIAAALKEVQIEEGIVVAGDLQEFGQIDILVNNAGIVLPGRVDNTSEEEWDRTMAVNLKGPFLVSKYAIAEMRKTGGGVIVHNASVVATKGVKDRAAYTASKGGLWALTKAMAADYLADKIRVNCVCPGTTYTPSLERRIQAFADPEKARADFIARQPMGRLGTVDDMVPLFIYLASDESSFATGTTFSVDGGMTI